MPAERPARPRVIHTAQALVDEVAEIPALPRRGGNAMARSCTRYAGGAVNILLAAARQGVEAVHAGAHGEGPMGDLVRESLAAEGVSLSAPMTEGVDTGVCFVMVEPSGERTFVTTMGAERRITAQSLATSDPQPGDLVCVSGYSLLEPTRDPLLTWLESLPREVSVVLDPGAAFADLDADTRRRVLALTDVWTSNAEEGEAETGLADIAACARALLPLLKGGEPVAVVRDGAKGCAVAVGDDVTVLPGYPQTPVDTNGAGDAHTGTLVASRALGLDWVEAARRGNAAGAIKVTRTGPATGPTAAEIDAFLAQHG